MSILFTTWFNKRFSITISLLLLALSGCMQNQYAADFRTPFPPIADSRIAATDNTVKMVNAVFYQSFIGGEWQYQGSTNLKNSINAYIQIPERLDMSEEAQENYLQQAICPAAQHEKMWQALNDKTLVVHIYTYKRKYSLYANCINPYTTG
ncbi:hypothetical protein [Paraglaciecola hydrolytica]|uniref:Lipoprotein n=1 Tax=Paraglaciecola hydrolytica TaxID=1799789 RepID=A0A136A3G0_9ALTE|nr:hypothetical protein [Paraglaciecola hydrolytica]KXI29766.1 hypothetical protein AX660_06930 [Paraglaciecola hydrolytica]